MNYPRPVIQAKPTAPQFFEHTKKGEVNELKK